MYGERMDAIGRVLRLIPRQISDRLRGGGRSVGSAAQTHGRSQPATATRTDQIAFIAIFIGFCMLLVPVLLVTVAAMLIIRIACIILDRFRGPKGPQ